MSPAVAFVVLVAVTVLGSLALSRPLLRHWRAPSAFDRWDDE
jgi:hypothetical protein